MCEQEWLPPRWVGVQKHRPPRGNADWHEVISRTALGLKVARYRLGMSLAEIEQLEMSFEEQGRFIRQKGSERFYYIVRRQVIGASLGEETNIVKIHWHAGGHVHGYPITTDELIGELKKYNPHELENFLAREQQ